MMATACLALVWRREGPRAGVLAVVLVALAVLTGCEILAGIGEREQSGGGNGGGVGGGSVGGAGGEWAVPCVEGNTPIFSDAFDDGETDLALWRVFQYGATIGEDPTARALIVAATGADDNSTAFYETNATFSLNDSAICVYAQVSMPGNGASFIDVAYQAAYMAAGVYQGKLFLGNIADFTLGDDYDAQVHAWWRLRHQDGSLFFDTAAADGIWIERVVHPYPEAGLPIDALYVDVGVSRQGESAPMEAEFRWLSIAHVN